MSFATLHPHGWCLGCYARRPSVNCREICPVHLEADRQKKRQEACRHKWKHEDTYFNHNRQTISDLYVCKKCKAEKSVQQ